LSVFVDFSASNFYQHPKDEVHPVVDENTDQIQQQS
jgi:hypothetical protein